MSIATLLNVLPPPSQPREVAAQPADWIPIENELGKLPQDYKLFIGHYGTGGIADFLSIFNPFSCYLYLNLFFQKRAYLEVLQILRKQGETIPYPVLPEPGGLFPLGSTDNGDLIFWLTKGQPENWTIVVNEARAPEYQHFDSGITEFLTGLLQRANFCRLFPEDFPHTFAGANPAFKPVEEYNSALAKYQNRGLI